MNLERETLSAEVVKGVLSGLRVAVGFDVHPFSTDPHRPLLICGQLFDGPCGGLCRRWREPTRPMFGEDHTGHSGAFGTPKDCP